MVVGVESSCYGAEPHPSWCSGGDGPDHEHHSPAVQVDGPDSLAVELAMDPDVEDAPRVTILPNDETMVLHVEVGQALRLSDILRQLAQAALAKRP